MTINTLYIIGNGFDLWHDLQTSYTDFSKYVNENNCEFEEFFTFKTNDEDLWTDFENDLGTFDSDAFYEDNNFIDVDNESFKPSMLYSLEDSKTEEAVNLVEGIKCAFSNWINEIDLEYVSTKITFDENAYFITFNYTQVLEKIYKVDPIKIFHIHGDIEKDYTNIIFGHNRKIECSPEFDEDGESTRTPFSDSVAAATYPLGAFEKPVQDIIEKNVKIFNLFVNVKKVIIMGHSLNDIDLPYFLELKRIIIKAEWYVSFYAQHEMAIHKEVMKKNGLEEELIHNFELDDIKPN